LQELAIEAADYKFGAPASIAAGPTHIVLNNVGKEDHQAQVAKIADDKTFEDLTGALGAQDIPAALGMLDLVGGPTGVAPGATVATSANLAPGQYVFLCFVESPDGVPHLAKGMISQLEVTGTASTDALPAGDGELALQDFAFVGATTLTAGQHTLTVTNKGPQVHEATVVKLNEGVTVDQLRQAFTSTEAPSGPPPFSGAGGVAGISAGKTVSMDLDLQPGSYAYVCFVPDAATGKPHAALGMIGELTVQ
jgi:plastocyanin